jgi:hypothetical protein
MGSLICSYYNSIFIDTVYILTTNSLCFFFIVFHSYLFILILLLYILVLLCILCLSFLLSDGDYIVKAPLICCLYGLTTLSNVVISNLQYNGIFPLISLVYSSSYYASELLNMQNVTFGNITRLSPCNQPLIACNYQYTTLNFTIKGLVVENITADDVQSEYPTVVLYAPAYYYYRFALCKK